MVQFAQHPRSRVQGFAGEIKPVALALSLAFGLGVGTVPAASAATITVNNNSGTSVVGQCTLRDAVQAANTDAVVQGCAAGSGSDTIVFTASVTGISLAGQIQINNPVSINGAGTVTLAPSGTNRALFIGSNVPVTISGITIQGNGSSNQGGAAIKLYGGGTLTIDQSTFSGNVTTARGGAIYNYGSALIVTNSTFTGNQASDGGAIFMYSGTLDITASTFSGNSAARGGAIFLYDGGVLTMRDSTLSGNSAGNGGAIYLYNASASTIFNSTISGNSSTIDGGAISLYDSILTVYNSTFTGNTAGGAGGAFYLTDTSGSVLTLVSTIVANSTDGSGTRDIAVAQGTVNATNSLIFNPGGNINGTNVANIIGQNPLLGLLQNNGGPTKTHQLLGGSPAIDKGSNPQALAFDQRGTPFARASGLTDIGAYEVQGAPPPPPVASVPVPTLSQWSLALLSAMMAGWAMFTGFGKRRRR